MWRQATSGLSAVLFALLVSGCMLKVHTPYMPDDSYALASAADSSKGLFSYQHKPIGIDSNILLDVKLENYNVHKIRFPSVGDNGQELNYVTAHYFKSKFSDRKGLVIILPIWGAYKYPSEKIAEEFVEQSRGSINVLQVFGEHDLFDWKTMADAKTEYDFITYAKRMTERFRNTVIDIRRIVDWAELQSDIDSKRVGQIGFSVGAVIGAMVLGSEQRIGASVLAMGAANPAEIFAACNGKLGAMRQRIMRRFGWSRAQYKAVFEKLFADGDPVKFAGRFKPETILMIDAYYDDCMPKAARDALWEAMGRPERISFLYTHKLAFLSMTPLGFYYSRYKIYQFMANALD